jgi:hypothetical protein
LIFARGRGRNPVTTNVDDVRHLVDLVEIVQG